MNKNTAMPTKKFVLALLFFTAQWAVSAQHAVVDSPVHEEAATEAQERHFRAAIMIGHTLIVPGHANTRLFVPSWGLDVEYWSSHRLGIGLHTDVELQDFVVLNQDQEEVERNEPFIVTLDGLYRPWKGLILMGGPGIELEERNNAWLFRAGFEYEVPVGTSFDLFPSLFFDQRFDGYGTVTLGLGVGKRF